MKSFYIYNLFEISIVICYQTLCQGTSVPQLPGAVPTILRNGTPDSAKYLICGTHQNGPKTASQLSSYYIEMYPKQVALIS